MSILTAIGLLIIGGVVLAIDMVVAVMLAVGVPMGFWLAVSRTGRTVGEIIEIGERRPRGRARVRVAYYTPEGRFETRSTYQRPQLGAQVPVRYRPGRPSQASTTSLVRFWRQMIIAIPVVAVVGALSIGMITSSVWYFTGSHAELQGPLSGGSLVLLLAFGCGAVAVNRWTVLLRWHRMVRTDGELLRYEEPSGTSHGPGRVLIAFQSATGEEEFWARAGTVLAGVGDTVTVYYTPDKPATSATVEEASDVRNYAIAGTVLALIFGALGVFAITML